jgi:carbamoylphosphate synthase large subunit
MRPITIWLNKNLSGTFNVIETLRAARQNESFHIVCSHTSPDFPALRISDSFEVEPRGPSESAYLDYCEQTIRKHQVDVFIPGKMLRAIVRERRRFEARNVRLVCAADADTLKLLENKASLYRAIPSGLAPVPEHRVVNDLAGFDAACAALRERKHVVCFKPAVSMFGLGFRILTERGTALDRLLSGDPIKIGLPEARLFLGQQPRFRDVIVMQYLPGPERSVDCLAQDGKLVCCVVRRKPMGTEGAQLLEENPAIEELARRLTGHFGLDGVYNIQFRDCDGTPYLLEINPRMSGGLHYACLSGVAFPYWAVRLALETASPEDVPRPRTGIRVGQVNKAIVL